MQCYALNYRANCLQTAPLALATSPVLYYLKFAQGECSNNWWAQAGEAWWATLTFTSTSSIEVIQHGNMRLCRWTLQSSASLEIGYADLTPDQSLIKNCGWSFHYSYTNVQTTAESLENKEHWLALSMTPSCSCNDLMVRQHLLLLVVAWY
jgi:hypothetical protein